MQKLSKSSTAGEPLLDMQEMSVHTGLNHVDAPVYTGAGDKPRDTLHDSLRQCIEEVRGGEKGMRISW